MNRIACIALLLVAWGVPAGALDERYEEEFSCVPVNGYVNLPGIVYDDLTPLALEVFNANTAAVTNALYALPFEEREDFIALYLEPTAREKHRYFFVRCRELADRRARAAVIEGSEIIPQRLRVELQEREKVRLALHDGAIPFRLDDRILYIPVPPGYETGERAVVPVGDAGLADSLAMFRKTADRRELDEEPFPHGLILATVKHVRQSADTLATTLSAYRVLVNDDWRLSSMYPPEALPGTAETVEYKWNLQPFALRDNSFCYGQFEKTVDFHGVEHIRYKATAVVILEGSYIQVGIEHMANTGLDTVNEINTDLTRWRDAIVAANRR